MATADWATPSELATELRLSVQTIYRLLESGKIRAVRIGGSWRINRSEALRASDAERPSPYQWMRDVEDRRDDRRR